MSSQFLTCMFIILVSVQLSCGWSLWRSDEKIEMSTAKSSKDDETNSPPTAIMLLDYEEPLPKCYNDYESSSAESSVIESVSDSPENIIPAVTYAPNEKDLRSSIDEEEEPTSNDLQIGRKDKETHSPRNTSTAMTNTPTTTGDTLNPTSNVNVPHNVTTDTESYDDKKPSALVGSGSTGSFFGSSTQKINETSEIVSYSTDGTNMPTTTESIVNSTTYRNVPRNVNRTASHDPSDLDPSASVQANTTIKTILSTSTDTMNTTEMAGSMSNGTTPEVNFGSFVNSGSASNAFSPLIFSLCILIFSISVIV